MRDYVVVYINGERHKISGEKAFMSLSDYLRYEKSLTGTKVVCSEGDCGACTVIIGNVHRLVGNEFSYVPVNSCISFMHILDGSHIVTIEGLKDSNDQLNEVQESMARNHGAQCGFCTPGFVCALNTGIENHLKANNEITEKRIKNCLTGNLCRCTGYQPIIDAGLDVDLKSFVHLTDKFKSSDIIADLQSETSKEVLIKSSTREIYLPVKLSDAIKSHEEKSHTFISGASDLGVLHNKRGMKPNLLMGLHNVEELYQIQKRESDVFIGARVNLHQIEEQLKDEFREFVHIIHIFASPQIKNRATLVGNVANASPIGDSIPFLMVMNAKVILIGPKGERSVDINNFYKGYKDLDLKPSEFIKGISIPYYKENEQVKLYKVSNRKDMDISLVTFAAKYQVKNDVISEMQIAVGGVGPVVLRVDKTEKELIGKPFETSAFEKAGNILKSEVTPIDDVRGSAAYRKVLSKNLLMKFCAEQSLSTNAGRA
ncbi:hypothetical protein A9Q84_07865 [Halobacteriovorax marinus]|uniref:FAD-binding PCMH-type domain-containing protein n=1 Tax=Halobacteriovorax marinus TaxID=97084 RepID=A0A1Y5F6B1_9BACT|nr:hypothetical protein A9Q84_07865 [Halobacteriovorax marinus]